jgi:hypothetical protein
MIAGMDAAVGIIAGTPTVMTVTAEATRTTVDLVADMLIAEVSSTAVAISPADAANWQVY